MELQLILVIFVFVCSPLVQGEAQQGGGHSNNLRDQLVFGRRRPVSKTRNRNSVEFAGGKAPVRLIFDEMKKIL